MGDAGDGSGKGNDFEDFGEVELDSDIEEMELESDEEEEETVADDDAHVLYRL